MVTLYHKTNTRNIQSILKHGLLANKAEYSDRVYLCRQANMDMGLGHALFSVKIPSDDPRLDNGGDWQVIIFRDIPPEQIKYLGNFKRNENPNAS